MSGGLLKARHRRGKEPAWFSMVGIAERPQEGKEAPDPAETPGKGASVQGGTVPKPRGQDRLGTERLGSRLCVSSLCHLPPASLPLLEWHQAVTCMAAKGSYKQAKGHRSLTEGDQAERLVAPTKVKLMDQTEEHFNGKGMRTPVEYKTF